ncbi:hypothetical protein CEXT_581301 [Caerostris extrusa]|uniref:Uncharacterized protein n=1 Tax=Caerostris extrusa TaxID=172846 RepID=A0AAV4S5S8_CAEEX|nr:hypothetical protein CEXT_581301 [Caerostris extrusa]
MLISSRLELELPSVEVTRCRGRTVTEAYTTESLSMKAQPIKSRNSSSIEVLFWSTHINTHLLFCWRNEAKYGKPLLRQEILQPRSLPITA